MDAMIYNIYENGSFFSLILLMTLSTAAMLLIMTALKRVLGVRFTSGWKKAMWIIMPIVTLFPFRLRHMLTMELPAIEPMATINIPKPQFYETGTLNHFGTFQYNAGGLTDTGILQRSIDLSAEDGTYTLLGSYAAVIWLMVSLILLFMELNRLRVLKRSIREKGIPCVSERVREILGSELEESSLKNIPVTVYPDTDTPFAVGIIYPMIVIPHEGYSDSELGFIIRHELTHIKKRDIPVKLFLIIFRCFNWFNPLAYVICRQAFEDMELACDDTVSRNMSEEQRKAYSGLILDNAAKCRVTAVSTYLSISGRSLKKRISSVLSRNKLSSLIPFTIAIILFLIFSSTYVTYSGYGIPFYIYPLSFEKDPYITSEGWRSCTADSYEAAAEKIFCQYMDMYTGDDVPEYYRIEDYRVNGTHLHENGELYTTDVLLRETEFVKVSYSAAYHDKCGNTAHNINTGAYCGGQFNGIVFADSVYIELERNGDTYTAVNAGIIPGTYVGANMHFTNNLTGEFGLLENYDRLADAGLLDVSWGSDKTPPAENIVSYAYQSCIKHEKETDARKLTYHINKELFGIESQQKADSYVLDVLGLSSLDSEIPEERIKLHDCAVIYCGEDYDLENQRVTVYLNVVEGDKSHGVRIFYENNREFKDKFSDIFIGKICGVEASDLLYTPVIFRDTFEKAAIPDEIRNGTAEDILEYMKTPRDGSDFTVNDYRNITEENGAYYAEVMFKGRLDGIYSTDIRFDNDESNDYIKVKVKD